MFQPLSNGGDSHPLSIFHVSDRRELPARDTADGQVADARDYSASRARCARSPRNPKRRLGQAGSTRPGADSGSMPSPETAPWPRTFLMEENAPDCVPYHDGGCSRFSRMSITDMDGLLPCGASASDRLPGMITAHSAAQILW